MFDHLEKRLVCYRLTYRCPYDDESVWALVQSLGGHLSIRQDCIDFWIHPCWSSFLVIKYPELTRRSDLDYL